MATAEGNDLEHESDRKGIASRISNGQVKTFLASLNIVKMSNTSLHTVYVS
jgi:hypothetical protein